MRMSEQNSGAQSHNAETSGIIDTLGNGFALLNRRPYLIWLPVLLDVLLWSGLRISVRVPASWIQPGSGAYPEGVAEAIHQFQEMILGVELVQLAGALTPILIADVGAASVPGLNLLSDMDVAGNQGWLLLVAGVVLMVFAGVSYLTMIGRLIVDRPAWGVRFAKDCVVNSLRVACVVLTSAGFLGLLFAPFAALGAGLYVIGVDITLLLAALGVIMLTWTTVFFFFSAHAIAIQRANTLEAMRASYALVRRHFVSVFGLLLIVIVIRLGTPVALQVFTETRWSVPFAIVVNAYVATGLVAATMLYFNNRSSTLFKSPDGGSLSATGS